MSKSALDRFNGFLNRCYESEADWLEQETIALWTIGVPYGHAVYLEQPIEKVTWDNHVARFHYARLVVRPDGPHFDTDADISKVAESLKQAVSAAGLDQMAQSVKISECWRA